MRTAYPIDPLACLPQQCRHGVSCEVPCPECDEEDIAPEAVAGILGGEEQEAPRGQDETEFGNGGW